MERDYTVRVLVVEDNEGDAELVRRYLTEAADADYLVGTVGALEEAVEGPLSEMRVDVVLLDLGLPDARGTEAVERIHAAHPDLPLVVLTGQADDEVGLRCIEAGAQDFVTKSDLTAPKLLRALGYAVRRARELRLRELQQAVERYEAIVAEDGTAEGRTRTHPPDALRRRDPEAFESLGGRYEGLLGRFVRHRQQGSERPLRPMVELARAMGAHALGPWELVDVHSGALRASMAGLSELHKRAFVVEGRQFILEMMGFLADHYRIETVGRTTTRR